MIVQKKKFLKEEKRYCSICVFQDSFNLWELNEIKRDRVKLNNYYSEILKVCCEAKKTCAFEENFWERDIYFVLKKMVYILILMKWKIFYLIYR